MVRSPNAFTLFPDVLKVFESCPGGTITYLLKRGVAGYSSAVQHGIVIQIIHFQLNNSFTI